MNGSTDQNRDTGADADVEPNSGDESVGQGEVTPFAAPVRITFNHIRRTLADPDGLSGKAVLDGIVKAGLLRDDSAKEITEVRHYQTKAQVEKTIVTIEEVEGSEE